MPIGRVIMQEGSTSSLPMISMTSSFCTVRGLKTVLGFQNCTLETVEVPSLFERVTETD